MAHLENKIAEIRNAELRQTIAAEVRELKDLLKKERRFGLVFERHLPELLPIYSAKIRSHTRVARKDGRLTETFIVERVAKGVATVKPEQGEGEPQNIPVTELVVVKRFGEAIFPALRHVESVLRGGDAPHHTLIEADNYHALQLLEWLYAGKVDCFYIDPPYNTGARDWKYNNDYVDANDSWRHSKWLAMMRRRLRLAKRLLNPDTGVLIVTIDEHEAHHLGMLLESEFPEAARQMATIVINQKGVAQGRLSRAEEYALFVFMPKAYLPPAPDDLLSPEREGKRFAAPRWEWLLRGGTNSRRQDRPGLFFPIHVDPERRAITSIGDPLPLREAPDVDAVDATVAWPLRTDRSLGNWRVSPPTLRDLVARGFVKLGGYDEKRKTWTVLYLGEKARSQIDAGVIRIADRDPDTGVVDVAYTESQQRNIKTVWHRPLHDSGNYGSSLLRGILRGEASFSFPKSLYAVQDALAAVVRDRKDALVVDFFAGSGTTLHALNLLNANDGGRRRCILVSNNEVSDEDGRRLMAQGHRPGLPEWERYGICQSVTWRRSKYSILGRRDDGSELEGEYFTGNTLQRELGRRFVQIGFVDPATLTTAAKKKQVVALINGLPQSAVKRDTRFIVLPDYKASILFDEAAAAEWLAALEDQGHITDFYIVTPSQAVFDEMKTGITDLLGPILVPDEEKRPMREGFPANLEYFRLDFLDRAQVETGGMLADILPALWMMAGCRGRLPTCKGNEKMLFFKGCPFAMLVEESAIKPFLAKLEECPNIDWVFLVTNDQDSFSRMCEWLPERVPVMQRVHLWRNYVDNFLINVDRAAGEVP